jgi:hypothetical protein
MGLGLRYGRAKGVDKGCDAGVQQGEVQAFTDAVEGKAGSSLYTAASSAKDIYPLTASRN